MVMMNPDICEWQKKQKKNKRITVTDEEKNVLKNVIAVYEISQK